MDSATYKATQWRHRQIIDGDSMSTEWDSFEDALADYRKAREVYPSDKYLTDDVADQPEWVGCEGGLDGVVSKVQNGWPELRAVLDGLLKDVELEVPPFPTLSKVRRRKRMHGDFGDSLDMTRVWSGHLDTAWERPQRLEKLTVNTKVITLAFDLCASGFITNEQTMWRAALCMLLVDSLARAGRTFEIWSVMSSIRAHERGPTRTWEAVQVKKTSEPIVMDRLCAMVSVSYLRTCGFTGRCIAPYQATRGMGVPANSGLPHTLAERQKAGETVVRIGQCFSKQAALEHFKQVWTAIEKGDQP